MSRRRTHRVSGRPEWLRKQKENSMNKLLVQMSFKNTPSRREFLIRGAASRAVITLGG